MQWETATPAGFPVCMRHNDCRLKKTAVPVRIISLHPLCTPVCGPADAHAGLFPRGGVFDSPGRSWAQRRLGHISPCFFPFWCRGCAAAPKRGHFHRVHLDRGSRTTYSLNLVTRSLTRGNCVPQEAQPRRQDPPPPRSMSIPPPPPPQGQRFPPTPRGGGMSPHNSHLNSSVPN